MPVLANASAHLGANANYTPNDALLRDAGEFAPAIARALPRPHAAYFEADNGRRRLIAYVARTAALGPEDADALATWSARRLAARYAPNAPEGFVEALKRATGVWTARDVECLIALLREGGEGQKALRHAQTVPVFLVAVLTALPAPLRRTRIVAHLPSRYLADLVARTVKHVWGRNPDAERLRRLALRLDRAASTTSLFAWLIEDVGVGRITPPPIPGTKWLRPILDVSDIERTALKFQNCLRTRAPLMLRGQGAYYEVLGQEPAVVEIVVGRGGLWRVGEIRGHANGPVSPELLAKIRAYLAQHGAQGFARPPTLALELAEAAGW
jgi:hypothetical protein